MLNNIYKLYAYLFGRRVFVKFHKLLMNSRDGFTGPVNIGNPIEFTMLELAEKIIQLTGSSSQIIFKPLPEGDPLQRQPIIDLAKKELDWQPKVQLEEGLQKTIAYFKSVI